MSLGLVCNSKTKYFEHLLANSFLFFSENHTMTTYNAKANFSKVPVVNVHKENIAKFEHVIYKDIQVEFVRDNDTSF